jgi:GNAT superfamily N-acetyltransferase
MPLLSDHALACRLERTEANANARFVEARARIAPSSGAQWIEVAGAYAMFDGVSSPCTQTFGLGLFQMPTTADMEKLEAFFRDRQAPVLHEVSPLADAALLPLLGDRGYRPIELSTVLYLPLSERRVTATVSKEPLQVRVADEHERGIWARTSAGGWSESNEASDLMLEFGQIAAAVEGNAPFLVELHGRPIATGVLAIHDRVALFAGASTIPEWRRRGAQQALLDSRFQYAAQTGCDLAMIVTAPGSSSQRNAERQGFRIAYTRIKWALHSAHIASAA